MILILGSRGLVGGELMRVFGSRAIGWDREQCDITRIKDHQQQIADLKISHIINCVAYNDVDGAEKNPEEAMKLNTQVVVDLVEICEQMKIQLVHFSTNYVFDGQKGEYTEVEKPHPLSIYAKTKYEGEKTLIKKLEKYYLVRTSVVFGRKAASGSSKRSFVEIMLGLSENTEDIRAVEDEINSLTYTVDLAGSLKYLLDSSLPYGIYHIVNTGQASWYDFAKEIFKIKNRIINLIPVRADEFKRPAVRPKKSVLKNTKLPLLRPWQEALKEFLISNP